MGLSEKVILETIDALENASSLIDAAEKLNMTEQGLRYRIKSHPGIDKKAIEKGFVTHREKPAEQPAGETKKEDIQDQNHSDLTKPPKQPETRPHLEATLIIKGSLKGISDILKYITKEEN